MWHATYASCKHYLRNVKGWQNSVWVNGNDTQAKCVTSTKRAFLARKIFVAGHTHTLHCARARNVAVLFAVFCHRHNRQRKVKANSTEKHIDVLSSTINLTATCFGALIEPSSGKGWKQKKITCLCLARDEIRRNWGAVPRSLNLGTSLTTEKSTPGRTTPCVTALMDPNAGRNFMEKYLFSCQESNPTPAVAYLRSQSPHNI